MITIFINTFLNVTIVICKFLKLFPDYLPVYCTQKQATYQKSKKWVLFVDGWHGSLRNCHALHPTPPIPTSSSYIFIM